MRAAVSASRAKSAEAGAVGEAQSKKPVARPAPAVPTGAREPRVKQGPKIYSFNSANDSGGSANLDKSILKVVINNKLEQKIIGVINEHKKQNSSRGAISGRLSAKKLQMHFLKDSVKNLKSNNLKVGQNSSLYKYRLLFHLHCRRKPKDTKKTLKLSQKRKKNPWR